MLIEYLDKALLTCVTTEQLNSIGGEPIRAQPVMVEAVTITPWGGNEMNPDIERVDFTITNPDEEGEMVCRTYFFLREGDDDTITLPAHLEPDDFLTDTSRLMGIPKVHQIYEIGYSDEENPLIVSRDLFAVGLFHIIPGSHPPLSSDQGVQS
jgi:hypothetical protein